MKVKIKLIIVSLATDVFGCEQPTIHCAVCCSILVACCVKLALYCILMSTDPSVAPQQKEGLFDIQNSDCSHTKSSANSPRVHLSCITNVTSPFVQH